MENCGSNVAVYNAYEETLNAMRISSPTTQDYGLDFKDTNDQFNNRYEFPERGAHWQDRASELTDEVSNLVLQIASLRRDKEKDANEIGSLKQDVDFMTNKMAAIVVEQRETRNHWLREKTELEGRIFQIQALNTQFQGSLRKKEKDYERLQLQLEKLVKDSNRGTQKSSVIMISKPLPKNSSQGSKQPGTLKDAELTASKTIIASLETENDQLRAALDTLMELNLKLKNEVAEHSSSIDDLKEQLTTAVARVVEVEATANSDSPNDSVRGGAGSLNCTKIGTDRMSNRGEFVSPYAAPPKTVLFSPTLRAGEMERDAEATAIYLLQSASKKLLLDVAASTPPAHMPPPPTTSSTSTCTTASATSTIGASASVATASASVRKAHFASGTPTATGHGSLQLQLQLEGTPSARPISWTVAQANTEVKRLRSRAEQLLAPRADVGGSSSLSSTEAGNHLNNRDRENQDVSTRARLMEAIALIHEQDRLIHQALMGRLPGFDAHDIYAHTHTTTAGNGNGSPSYTPMLYRGSGKGGVGGATAIGALTDNEGEDEDENCMNNSFDCMFDDKDVMPPASPETLQLLEFYGWKNVPRMIPAEEEASSSSSSFLPSSRGALAFGSESSPAPQPNFNFNSDTTYDTSPVPVYDATSATTAANCVDDSSPSSSLSAALGICDDDEDVEVSDVDDVEVDGDMVVAAVNVIVQDSSPPMVPRQHSNMAGGKHLNHDRNPASAPTDFDLHVGDENAPQNYCSSFSSFLPTTNPAKQHNLVLKLSDDRQEIQSQSSSSIAKGKDAIDDAFLL